MISYEELQALKWNTKIYIARGEEICIQRQLDLKYILPENYPKFASDYPMFLSEEEAKNFLNSQMNLLGSVA